MAAQNLTQRYREGTVVRILNSGYGQAKIVEYRGPLGPKGTPVYRVRVQEKPRHVDIEVREDQLEILDDTAAVPPEVRDSRDFPCRP